MKNQFYKVILFMIIVVAGAVMLSWIPETPITFGKHKIELRKTDVLSDIRIHKEDTIAIVVPAVKPKFVDSCKTGIVCFDDYSEGRNALSRFYEALQAGNRAVRIAYFGDSFIEGDILTSSLRELFHKKYGGNGAGFAPINCITAGFRTTIRTYVRGWSEHSVVDSSYSRSKQGISGHYFYPDSSAVASYVCYSSFGKQADSCSTASFYFITDGNLNFTTTVNQKDYQNHSVEGSEHVQKVSVNGKIGRVRIVVNKSGANTRFFGVSMDNDDSGIVVDNFSLRGTSGINLQGIPENILHDFDSLRHYDLIVLQYGLNVASKNGTNYASYKKSMINVINYFQKNFPKSDFLLVSVGDRGMKSEGEIVTMPGVLNMCAVQQAIAADCKIAFWNLINVMNLDGGIAGYVESKPSKANYDYTHINTRGGALIAKHLFETFEYGKERYFAKKEYDKQ